MLYLIVNYAAVNMVFVINLMDLALHVILVSLDLIAIPALQVIMDQIAQHAQIVNMVAVMMGIMEMEAVHAQEIGQLILMAFVMFAYVGLLYPIAIHAHV